MYCHLAAPHHASSPFHPLYATPHPYPPNSGGGGYVNGGASSPAAFFPPFPPSCRGPLPPPPPPPPPNTRSSTRSSTGIAPDFQRYIHSPYSPYLSSLFPFHPYYYLPNRTRDRWFRPNRTNDRGIGSAMDDSHRNPNKIFIGGISAQTTSLSLRDYFSKFGGIVDVAVVRDKTTGRSRGFGFCSFSSPDVAQRCLETEKHVIDGTQVELRASVPRSELKPSRGGSEDELSRKVHVAGLQRDVNQAKLKELIEMSVGPVESVSIILDRHTNRSKGFGFVTFSRSEDADNALSQQTLQDGQYTIELKRARPPNPRAAVMTASYRNETPKLLADNCRDVITDYGNAMEPVYPDYPAFLPPFPSSTPPPLYFSQGRRGARGGLGPQIELNRDCPPNSRAPAMTASYRNEIPKLLADDCRDMITDYGNAMEPVYPDYPAFLPPYPSSSPPPFYFSRGRRGGRGGLGLQARARV